MYSYALLCLVIALAGFTQGFSGFGSVLLSLPLLAMFLPIKTAIPLVSLLSWCMSLILIVQMRRHLQWPKIIPLLLAALPGIPVGVYLLKTMAPWVLELILGMVLVAFPVYHRYRRRGEKCPHGRWAYLAGFCSGCLGGSIGASGPPVIVYTALQPWPKDEIKVTLAGYFLISGLAVIAAQAGSGLITGRVMNLFWVGLPFLVAGVLGGSQCYGKITGESYRSVITLLILALGIFMVAKAVLW